MGLPRSHPAGCFWGTRGAAKVQPGPLATAGRPLGLGLARCSHLRRNLHPQHATRPGLEAPAPSSSMEEHPKAWLTGGGPACLPGRATARGLGAGGCMERRHQDRTHSPTLPGDLPETIARGGGRGRGSTWLPRFVSAWRRPPWVARPGPTVLLSDVVGDWLQPAGASAPAFAPPAWTKQQLEAGYSHQSSILARSGNVNWCRALGSRGSRVPQGRPLGPCGTHADSLLPQKQVLPLLRCADCVFSVGKRAALLEVCWPQAASQRTTTEQAH